MIRDGTGSPWQMGDVLARVAAEGRLGTDAFGRRAAGIVAGVGSEDLPERNGLIGAVCVMCAVIGLLGSRRLTANAERRNCIAVTLWSALSFQAPSAEPMLERLRRELLDSARSASLRLATEGRRRTDVGRGRVGEPPWRVDPALSREEIDVLRWTLADQSMLLGRDYKDVAVAESEVLARGLEVGLMLKRSPSFEHFELASGDVPAGEDVSLSTLMERRKRGDSPTWRSA